MFDDMLLLLDDMQNRRYLSHHCRYLSHHCHHLVTSDVPHRDWPVIAFSVVSRSKEESEELCYSSLEFNVSNVSASIYGGQCLRGMLLSE